MPSPDDITFDDLLPAAPQSAAPQATPPAQPTAVAGGAALTPDQIQFDDLVPPPPPTGSDVAKSAGTGLVKGALGLWGGPGDLMDAIGNGAEWAMQRGLNAVGALPNGVQPQSLGDIAAENRKLSQGSMVLPRTADLQGVLEDVTGPLYEPQTTTGKYAETAASFVPGAMALPGNAAVNAIRLGVAPGLASEAAGQATQGTKYELPARIAAAIGTGSIGGTARRLVTPFPSTPERQALVDTLQQEGVPLTAGQATGNKPLQWMESTLSDAPGAGGNPLDEAQKAAFTRAALQRIGIDADHATPDVLAGARQSISNTFDQLSARNTATFDPQFGQDLGRVLNDYDSMTLPNQHAPIVQQTIDGFTQLGGSMPGTQYQAVRSNLDKAARGVTISNPPLSQALFGMRNALDGAMTRSISPEDADAWAGARNQWRNWKVIQQAATGAGENAAQGNISPAALRSATVGRNRGAYAQGQGDFADLARAGVGVMSPLPNSGTAPRMMVQHMANMAGAGLGFLVAHDTDGLLLGEAASQAAPSVLGRLLMSRPSQAYLSNQMLNGPSRPLSALDRLMLSNQARASAASPVPQ